MKITKVIIVANNEALKKTIEGTLTIKGKKIKGHVIVDVYKVADFKKNGTDQVELVAKDQLVEAAHALHQNENVKTSSKLYIISGTELDTEDNHEEKEKELEQKEARLEELEEKEKSLDKREKAIAKAEKAIAKAEKAAEKTA